MSPRTVLVSGAGQGIGLAIARHFAERGDVVIGADISLAGEEALAECGAHFVRLDVTDPGEWRALIDRVVSDHDGVHILVNNAGTDGAAGAARDPVHTPVEDWDQVFKVNTRGCFLGCKFAIPAIAKSGGGAIVNLSSVAADVPTLFLTAYGASKAAVDHLTRSVALYCANEKLGIRCNSVHPGQVRTPMLDALFARMAGEAGVDIAEFEQGFLRSIPLGEFQQPQDIAEAVGFLASARARMITGQALAVDGGFLLKS